MSFHGRDQGGSFTPNLIPLVDAVASSTVLVETSRRGAEATRARCSTAAAGALLPPQHGHAIATIAVVFRLDKAESIIWVNRLRAQRGAGRGDRESARR